MLEVTNLGVSYRGPIGDVEIIRGVNISLKEREILAIVGSSGVGKTTLLKAVAGLIKPSSGRVAVRGRIVKSPSRDRGLVFQQYCVFPWLTVAENIELGSRCGIETSERVVKQEVARLLEATGLSEFQHRYPSQISGGMQQRTAIARTLAADPSVLLLDEPFGALDAITRLQVQDLVRSIFDEIRQAILLVTHDIEEAVLLADRVALLSGKPSSIIREWEVKEPRRLDNPMDLGAKERSLVREIFCLLRENNGA